MSYNQQLAEFLDASPSPHHAVSNMVERLSAAGFVQLHESQAWQLEPAGKYFVTRNGSSLIAFVNGRRDVAQSGLRLVGAHTDSPCLMVKPNADIYQQGYLQLAVEVYGGALLNPWFDRDLSIAGRLVYSDSDNQLRQRLVDFKRPVAIIPSLAIHLDREANKNRTINAQNDIPPLLMRSGDSVSFSALLSEQFLSEGDSLQDYELCLYDTQGASELGIPNEFFASARLDNLLSCHVGLEALLAADGENSCLLVCNDHEEVGSVSAIGADGPFLEAVVKRLCGDQLHAALASSLLISCDNAHAVHPNYADRHDAGHMPTLNGGPVIKVNVKQRYATNGITSALFRQLCAAQQVPVQTFVARNDMGCGSTIGPVSASRIGVPTLDVGIAQLAMHSCREMTGSDDPERLTRVLQGFFNQLSSVSAVGG